MNIEYIIYLKSTDNFKVPFIIMPENKYPMTIDKIIEEGLFEAENMKEVNFKSCKYLPFVKINEDIIVNNWYFYDELQNEDEFKMIVEDYYEFEFPSYIKTKKEFLDNFIEPIKYDNQMEEI